MACSKIVSTPGDEGYFEIYMGGEVEDQFLTTQDLPKRATEFSCSYDLPVLMGKPGNKASRWIAAHGMHAFNTQLKLAANFPKRTSYLKISHRSSWYNRGLLIDAIIDGDYTGEIKIVVRNISNHMIVVKNREALAQGTITPYLAGANETPGCRFIRGSGGFGSTTTTADCPIDLTNDDLGDATPLLRNLLTTTNPIYDLSKKDPIYDLPKEDFKGKVLPKVNVKKDLKGKVKKSPPPRSNIMEHRFPFMFTHRPLPAIPATPPLATSTPKPSPPSTPEPEPEVSDETMLSLDLACHEVAIFSDESEVAEDSDATAPYLDEDVPVEVRLIEPMTRPSPKTYIDPRLAVLVEEDYWLVAKNLGVDCYKLATKLGLCQHDVQKVEMVVYNKLQTTTVSPNTLHELFIFKLLCAWDEQQRVALVCNLVDALFKIGRTDKSVELEHRACVHSDSACDLYVCPMKKV